MIYFIKIILVIFCWFLVFMIGVQFGKNIKPKKKGLRRPITVQHNPKTKSFSMSYKDWYLVEEALHRSLGVEFLNEVTEVKSISLH